jgi:hypothetical protein
MKRSFKILHLSKAKSRRKITLATKHAAWTQTVSPNPDLASQILSGSIPGLEYLQVGEVVAESVDQAYFKSQTSRGNWAERDGAKLFINKPPRSTSVGDIIDDGTARFLVTPVGFQQLNGAPQ